SSGFSERHRRFWDWIESIEDGEYISPRIEAWPRGGAKSTSAELAVARLGVKLTRRFALYVCHEIGTPILDPDSDSWMRVEDHPSAWERICDGVSVQACGLPFSEVVTPEHRYWSRRITRKDRGHGRPAVHTIEEPHWTEARNLDSKTWLGLPIDT